MKPKRGINQLRSYLSRLRLLNVILKFETCFLKKLAFSENCLNFRFLKFIPLKATADLKIKWVFKTLFT